jgi:hypothetical protein
MRKFIKEVLVEMHKTVSTDKYGQVSRDNFTPSLFGDKRDEVEQYCKENKGILQFSTYGGRFVGLLPNPSIRTYKAFTVEDDEIRKACREALHTNENWKRNINSY